MNQTIAPTLVAAQAQSAQTPVFDLLARSWTLEAGITDVAMDPAGKVAGFALTDGRVALMSLDDADSPFSRMRVEADSGRSTIRPREKPVAAPILTAKLAEGAPFLTPSKMIGLIVAAPDGRIHRVTPRGQVIVLNSTPGPVFAVASDGLGHLAIARDGRTDLLEETGMTRLVSLLTAGPATALAFAPDDQSLAVMMQDSLIMGHPRQGYETHPLGGSGPMAFSKSGAWLAGSNGKDGIWLLRRSDRQVACIGKFRARPSAIAFSSAANAVFASGAFRVAGWSLSNPPFESETHGALKTGRSGLVLIERVAAHPVRELIALGTADGAVSVAQAGRPEEMTVRQADGGAITALAWSADGAHLAIGTATGNAALVTLPPQLFK